MRKFTLNIFGIGLILVFFNCMLFFIANEIYFNKYKFKESRKFHSFIFADSHGKCLNIYGESKGICNLSAGYESYFDMNRKLKYLIQHNYVIDTIYISVDDHLLSPIRCKNNNLDRSIHYSTALEFDHYFEYFFLKYINYYLPIFNFRFRVVLKKFLKSQADFYLFNKNSQLNQNAWIKFSEQDRIRFAKSTYSVSYPYYQRSKELTASFLDIINICKSKNINLIGVKFPLSRNLIEVLGNSNYGADSILKANGFPVLDHKLDFVNDDCYFRDVDHLNNTGGKEFAKKLFSITTKIGSN